MLQEMDDKVSSFSITRKDNSRTNLIYKEEGTKKDVSIKDFPPSDISNNFAPKDYPSSNGSNILDIIDGAPSSE